MTYVAICADEQKDINTIKQYLLGYQRDVQCELKIYQFISGKDLCDSSATYDLIFLSVEMRGMDGLQTARILRQNKKRTQIIFVASHSKYALNAFEVHPFYYITRPVTIGVIYKVMNEFIKYFNNDFSPNNILEFKGIKGPLLLNQTDIYVFEYIGNRRVLILTCDKKYVIRSEITEITNLVDPALFISPHRGFLINIKYLKSLNNCILYMKNDIEVPVAQKKIKEVQKFINCLNKAKIGIK